MFVPPNLTEYKYQIYSSLQLGRIRIANIFKTRKFNIRIRMCNIQGLLFEYSNIFVLHCLLVLSQSCEKQLRNFGLKEHLKKRLTNNRNQIVKSQRNEEALVYLREVLGRCGYNNNFMIYLIEPAHNKNNQGPDFEKVVILPRTRFVNN